MPTDFHRKFHQGYFAFDWKKHINNLKLTPLFFQRYILNIHEKLQRGHPFNFSGVAMVFTLEFISPTEFGRYVMLPWPYVGDGGGIFITPVCPYIGYMVCSANFLYNLSFDISKIPTASTQNWPCSTTCHWFFFLEIKHHHMFILKVWRGQHTNIKHIQNYDWLHS